MLYVYQGISWKAITEPRQKGKKKKYYYPKRIYLYAPLHFVRSSKYVKAALHKLGALGIESEKHPSF